MCTCALASVLTARNQLLRVGCQFRHVKCRSHLPIERDGLLFNCVRVSDVAENERIERKGFAVGEHLLELASALRWDHTHTRVYTQISRKRET